MSIPHVRQPKQGEQFDFVRKLEAYGVPLNVESQRFVGQFVRRDS
jgi:hypothetical protein